jgi:hypothetical protein
LLDGFFAGFSESGEEAKGRRSAGSGLQSEFLEGFD